MRPDPSTLLYCWPSQAQGREHDGISPSDLSRTASAGLRHTGLFRPLHNAAAHLLQQCRSIDLWASGFVADPVTGLTESCITVWAASLRCFSASVSLEARELLSDLCLLIHVSDSEDRDKQSEKVVERGSGESSGECVRLSRMVLSLNPNHHSLPAGILEQCVLTPTGSFFLIWICKAFSGVTSDSL